MTGPQRRRAARGEPVLGEPGHGGPEPGDAGFGDGGVGAGGAGEDAERGGALGRACAFPEGGALGSDAGARRVLRTIGCGLRGRGGEREGRRSEEPRGARKGEPGA